MFNLFSLIYGIQLYGYIEIGFHFNHRPVGSFQFLTINKAVLNIYVQVPPWAFLLVVHLEGEWLEGKENHTVSV